MIGTSRYQFHFKRSYGVEIWEKTRNLFQYIDLYLESITSYNYKLVTRPTAGLPAPTLEHL